MATSLQIGDDVKSWLTTTGSGFTVIVNVSAVPAQVTLLFEYCGVTVIVETRADVVKFSEEVKEIVPIPLVAESPVAVEELVQE